MADISTYRRCVVAYATGGVSVGQFELRAASDPVVTAAPANWATPTDTELASGRWLLIKK